MADMTDEAIGYYFDWQRPFWLDLMVDGLFDEFVSGYYRMYDMAPYSRKTIALEDYQLVKPHLGLIDLHNDIIHFLEDPDMPFGAMESAVVYLLDLSVSCREVSISVIHNC